MKAWNATREWAGEPGRLSRRRFFPLRYRFILISSASLIVLFGTLALMLSIEQSRSIRYQVERRGLAMAQSLAATSKAQLATYNYVALGQCANQAIQDPDIVSVIIHDKEGRVAGYSGRPDLEGKFLEDPQSVKALSAKEPLIQKSLLEPSGLRVLDIALPVFMPGSEFRWGLVRVVVSLEPMYQQIHQTQWIIGAIGALALIVGILISSWAARRITRPLGFLVEATVEAAQGNLNPDLHVKTRDEVEVLASNFSVMIGEILGQRQQLEQQLAEIKRLQHYTEKLLTTMNDGLISVDSTGNVAAINPAACKMLGWSEGDSQESSASTLLRDAPYLLRYIEEMLRGDGGRNQREIAIRREREDQVILASSSLLAGEGGKPLEVITNLHDITEFKQLEARMRQSERLAALGTLAAGMAHEIRNPLSAIKTFVQLLPRKVEKPGFLEKFNRTVPRELERINRLIEDLLELARTPRYHFQAMDLPVLLEQSLEAFEAEVRSRSIDIRVRIPSGLPPVWVDSHQLAKVVDNLLRNAIQAMPEGGHIDIDVSWAEEDVSQALVVADQNGWASVSVRDTGMGIGAEDLESIFNPFFTTKATGTGLGLAIAHKVITEHKGRIEAASEIGLGTTFVFHLPTVERVVRVSPV